MARLDLEEGKRRVEHRVVLSGNERSYEVNGKRKTPSALRGSLPCVLITPDDLQLVKASSSKRRDAIDALAVQLSANYPTLRSEYQQALRQRNLLIKDGIHSGSLFDSWDESHAVHGARLCLARWRLFDRLFSRMTTIYEGITPDEQLDARYIPSWERASDERRQRGDITQYEQPDAVHEMTLEDIQDRLLEQSRELSDAELRRGISLVGPHKDEMAFFINGKTRDSLPPRGNNAPSCSC